MVRNKNNIIIKDKGKSGKAKGDLPTQHLPNMDQFEFHNTRVIVGSQQLEKEMIKKDMKLLREDFKVQTSS